DIASRRRRTRGPTAAIGSAPGAVWVVATAIVARTLSRTVVNQRDEVGRDLWRFVPDLVFSYPNHMKPTRSEPPIPPAVLAEGSPGAMGLEPVELTDQLRVGPEAVGLEAVVVDRDPGVQARAWDLMGIEEGKEEL